VAAAAAEAKAKAETGALLITCDLPIAHFSVNPPDELARRAEADQALIAATAAEDLEHIVRAIEAHSHNGSPDAVRCIVQASLCCGMRS
jgi:hypothetical protein